MNPGVQDELKRMYDKLERSERRILYLELEAIQKWDEMQMLYRHQDIMKKHPQRHWELRLCLRDFTERKGFKGFYATWGRQMAYGRITVHAILGLRLQTGVNRELEAALKKLRDDFWDTKQFRQEQHDQKMREHNLKWGLASKNN